MSSTTPPVRGRRVRRLGVVGCPAVFLVVLAACGLNRPDVPAEEDMSESTIEEVQERYTPEWMELPGVVGTGIGLCDDDEPCIRVFLQHPSPEADDAIPERVEGYRVDLVVTGPIRPRG